MIYFDHSATTPISKEALKSYVETSQRVIGNPSSLHELGMTAQRLLASARGSIAKLLQVDSSEIFFTSGGTEGNNWALKGTALEKRAFGTHVILSSIEHPSVIESAQQLETLGFEIDFAPVDERGFVKINELARLLKKETIMVSVMAVNNEIGSIQPIQAIAKLLADDPSIHFHVDAVQAVGMIETAKILPERVDFATFSAHKFYGPRGVGFLYQKKGKRLAPLLTGGGQESGQRSGTENIPGIVAMARAFRGSLEEWEVKRRQLLTLKQAIFSSLQAYARVHFFTEMDSEVFAPHIFSFGIEGIRGEVLVHAFEEKRIFLSTTSACSSRQKIPAGTLLAMGVPKTLAESAVRISLGESNTMAEVEQFLTVFHQLYEKFRKVF